MLGLFFGFNGRINRLTYWFGNIAIGVVGFFGMMFGFMLAGAQGYEKTAESALRMISTAGLTVGPVLLAMSWASLAMQVKRFHDRGRTGLFTLAPLLPVTMVMMTVVGGAATNAPFQQVMGQAALWMNILFLINIAFFIDLGCLPGKEGPNKYGDPPRGGFGMGQPSAPSAPAVPGRAAPAPASRASLGSAEEAMQRAIAEQAKAKAAAPQPARAPAPGPAAPRPAMATAGAPTGFGRKPAR
jgi:uncharacterized membrane protein YhaH (DUF805 family)